MSCIVLVGMPACGKSTVGVILAKTLGKGFIDTDLLIQADQKLLLQEIIDQKGNDYFQQVERHVLSKLDAADAVIATGGSAVYYEEAMAHLKTLGQVVYLSLPLSEIQNRLNNISTRGITMGPGETLAQLYQKRVPLYQKYADLTLETRGMTPEQVVQAIAAAALSGPLRRL